MSLKLCFTFVNFSKFFFFDVCDNKCNSRTRFYFRLFSGFLSIASEKDYIRDMPICQIKMAWPGMWLKSNFKLHSFYSSFFILYVHFMRILSCFFSVLFVFIAVWIVATIPPEMTFRFYARKKYQLFMFWCI